MDEKTRGRDKSENVSKHEVTWIVVSFSSNFTVWTTTIMFTGGPWVVMNHYLVVSKPSEVMETTTAIWLRFSELQIEYYDEEPLYQIAERFGRPDITTASSTRGNQVSYKIEAL